MFNLLCLIEEVKLHLDQEKTIQILSFIGYEVSRHGKFKLIVDERTASASVDKKGNIKDFGSGCYGDSVLTAYHGLSTMEATKYIAECIGMHYEE